MVWMFRRFSDDRWMGKTSKGDYIASTPLVSDGLGPATGTVWLDHYYRFSFDYTAKEKSVYSDGPSFHRFTKTFHRFKSPFIVSTQETSTYSKIASNGRRMNVNTGHVTHRLIQFGQE